MGDRDPDLIHTVVEGRGRDLIPIVVRGQERRGVIVARDRERGRDRARGKEMKAGPMNQIKKKPLPARAIPKPFNRQAINTPLVAQLKPAMPMQNSKRSVAPPVYRPQPVPKVLQKKSSSTHGPLTGQVSRQPIAPPVYRPEAKKLVQPKLISQQRNPVAAPPVYRPEQKRIAQPKMATGHTNSKVSPPNSIANRIAQLKKNNLQAVVQLAKYRSKKDKGLTVDVDAGANGVFAQAEKDDQEYERSHLQYAVHRYMNATGDGGTVRTSVPMATQTDTMKSFPTEVGIGTLMVAEAMEYLNSQKIAIFQPDIMSSDGGKIMKRLVTGTNLSAGQMERLIAETDGGGVSSSSDDDGVSCGCSCLFSWCSSKSPEKKPLLDNSVKTYPAIRVDYEATKITLDQKVKEKFELIE